jgi:hypothetical protein
VLPLDAELVKREQYARIGEGIITFLSRVLRENGASRNISLHRTDNPAAPWMVRLGGTDTAKTFWECVVTYGESPVDAVTDAIHVYILSHGD